MKKNIKQSDLFSGIKPEPKKRPITAADVCRIFNGKVISEKEYAEQVRLLKMNRHRRSGEWLVKQLREKGVMWWVSPDPNRVSFYKKRK